MMNNDPPKYSQQHQSHMISVDEAVNRIGIGGFQHKVLFVTGTCFMADSMEVMFLAFLSRVLLDEWEDHGIRFIASITSCLFAGSLVGTLIWGPVGDHLGRKPVLCWCGLLISIFGLGSSFCNGYATLLPVLFMIGFGIGGLTVPFDILTEFLPTEERGKYLLLIKYFWTVGCMIVPVLGYVSLEIFDSWRLLAVLCVTPCMVSTALGLCFVPESPRWLVSKGRTEEALSILKDAAVQNGVNPLVAFPPGCPLVDDEKEDSSFTELLSPKWRKLTLLLWAIWAGYAFSYYGMILTVTRIFDWEDNDDDDANESGDRADFDYLAIFLSSTAEVVGTTIAIFQVDSLGRKPTLVGSFAIGGISLFFLCVLAAGNGSRMTLVCLAFIGRSCVMAGACVTWISTAELLSTELRATGHSTANAFGRIGASFSPFLVEGSPSIVQVGIVLLVVNIYTAFCSYQLPETKGVELGKASLFEIEEKHSAQIT